MISREEYIKALDIVEAYHKQLNSSIATRTYKALSDVEIGKFVECITVHRQSQNSLTRGKEYEVIDKFSIVFEIFDDKNRRKRYRFGNSQFKALANYTNT